MLYRGMLILISFVLIIISFYLGRNLSTERVFNEKQVSNVLVWVSKDLDSVGKDVVKIYSAYNTIKTVNELKLFKYMYKETSKDFYSLLAMNFENLENTLFYLTQNSPDSEALNTLEQISKVLNNVQEGIYTNNTDTDQFLLNIKNLTNLVNQID